MWLIVLFAGSSGSLSLVLGARLGWAGLGWVGLDGASGREAILTAYTLLRREGPSDSAHFQELP